MTWSDRWTHFTTPFIHNRLQAYGFLEEVGREPRVAKFFMTADLPIRSVKPTHDCQG